MQIPGVKRFFLSFLMIVFLAAHAGSIAIAAPEENNDERLLASKIEGRLSSIEKKIKLIQDNQNKINAKQAEIKSELDTLGVWIRRR